MCALEEAKTVWNAYMTYKADIEKLPQSTIPEFCFPTCGKHPKAIKALERFGFVHRIGQFGIGYYADNVR